MRTRIPPLARAPSRQTRLSLLLYGRGIRIIVSRRSALFWPRNRLCSPPLNCSEYLVLAADKPGDQKLTYQQKVGGLILGFGSGHYVFKRLDALGFELGMGERLAREHLIAHRGVVDERSFDERGLSEVFGLQSFEGVHIRMMCARAVVERVLDELESGEADGVEGFMIGAASVAHGDRRNAQIFQGLDPLLENRGAG